MTIAIDIRCLMHPHYSGVAEYAYNLLDNLFKLDNQNQYKLFYNSQQNIAANLPGFSYPNVKKFGFNYSNKLLNLSLKLFAYPKLDQLLSGAEVFFLPNLNFSAFTKNCKKILTIHDLSFQLYPEYFSPKQRFWHNFINPKKLITNCEKIIADSENTKNDLINLYRTPATKIKVIHSGLDHNLYKPITLPNFQCQQFKNKYQLPENFILFLGTLEPRKNISGIIQAFDLLKLKYPEYNNLHLVIAGEKGWNHKKIFQLAENSPFTKQIFYLDYIKREDKPLIYNLAKLFIFPSYYEGFGFPPLEAQACGLPVIASANSSFPEILGETAYLVNPDHLEEISEAIHQILSIPELKNKLIAQGLENVKRFSWQTCAQETLNYLIS
jgi:glycosyltransferase involved in cell wall biosynthesis